MQTETCVFIKDIVVVCDNYSSIGKNGDYQQFHSYTRCVETPQLCFDIGSVLSVPDI